MSNLDTFFPLLQCPAVDCPGQIPIQLDRCPTCGNSVDPPNVRMANHPDEVSALESRYQQACELALEKGFIYELGLLERAAQESCATINSSVIFMASFLENANITYASYQKQLLGDGRLPSTFENDTNRLKVETSFWGSASMEIVYAALSPDGRGLWSYGPAGMVLRPQAIARRATVLEENTFEFHQKHRLGDLDAPRPWGYYANWARRARVLVSKLAGSLQKGIPVPDVQGLILWSNGNRRLDKFAEIHIFGIFDLGAVADFVVRRESIANPIDQLLVEVMAERLHGQGRSLKYV